MKFQITFRDTSDQDLIRWYNETPYGDRAHIIRESLREYIKNNYNTAKRKTMGNLPSNALKNLEL